MIGSVDPNSALAAYINTSSATRPKSSGETAKSGGKSACDELNISESGRLLSKLGNIKLPNWQSVNELKNEFSAKLDKVLSDAGIDNNPPFTITQTDNGVFSVTGDNPKAAGIEYLPDMM